MNHFWLEKTSTFLFIKFVKGFSLGKCGGKGFPHFGLAHSTCLAVQFIIKQKNFIIAKELSLVICNKMDPSTKIFTD